ncbi:MAG: hypothetical protein ACLU9Q_10435 [Marvinbryantia sp.]|uniref:hypothetical protein n=1 Tax=Marvinbryantia sp. TaxID=2496532 RepID=UPI00260137E7|nr:hypothetical protein [uncultured Marvinbryantia sp.]
MIINGIGEVGEEVIKGILTNEGIDALESGEMSLEEAGEMYKLEQVKKFSRIGEFGDTFRANFARIPGNIYDKLSPEEAAQLVDAFYKCYGDGKNA